jgi:hypothetical protein
MSKQLRSTDTLNVAFRGPSRMQRARLPVDQSAAGTTERIVGGDNITALVDSVFGNLREGIWWRVLPIEGTNDDICTGTGQAWDVLLPLLLERDFIRVHGEPTLSGYQFRKRSWETLCTTFRGEGQLQMGTLQTKKGGKAWYIARGSLVFKNPKLQDDAYKNGDFTYRQSHRSLDVGGQDISLRASMAGTLRELDARRILHRFQELQVSSSNNQQLSEQTTILQGESETPLRLLDRISGDIKFALRLNLDCQMRLNRAGTEDIEQHKRKQFGELERNMAIHISNMWGWSNPAYTWRERQRIGRAALRMVAYDNGFVREVGVSQLHIWDKQLAVGVETGLEAKKTLSPSHAGSKSYMDEIEKLHPGYLRELFATQEWSGFTCHSHLGRLGPSCKVT